MDHGGSASRVVLLASRSARRRALLERAGIGHEVVESGVDDGELGPGSGTPWEWVTGLAYLKARAASEGSARGGLVLGADTTCVLDGRVIGQAREEGEAAGMILGFVGRWHEVATGVCVVCARTGRRAMGVSRARVWMGDVPMREVSRYVASGEWRGKAGAYNFEERAAGGWPLELEGEVDTVVGLPLGLVRRLVRAVSEGGGA